MDSEQNSTQDTSMPDLIVVREPDSEAAQAYRSVRETLRHANGEQPIRSVLLADCGSRDRAGEAAANIGASFALNREPTVLIDLDARAPVLHALFNTAASPGLIDWLAGDSVAEGSAPEVIRTSIKNLSVLPPGDRSTASTQAPIADLLTDSAFRSLVASLGTSTGCVAFHGTVAPMSSQVLTAAANVDAVVMIIRSGVTKRTDAQRAKESLQRVGANLLGVVLTED
jgi:Mrp family chromosome partitioning ATPase